MQYAVIFTYSFDDDVAVYLFPDIDSAKAFLLDNYKEELRIDTEENGYDTTAAIQSDGMYARIANSFSDHDDVTEFRIGSIYP